MADAITFTEPPAADDMARHRFTVDDVDRMLESGVLDPDLKFELIDGQIVLMPAQNMPHIIVRARLIHALHEQLPRSLDVAPEATTLIDPLRQLEPDIVVFRYAPDARRVRPDLVELMVEVTHTTHRRDLQVKPPIYAAAGVKDYWVVDLEAGLTHVFRKPDAESAGWGEHTTIAFGDPISPLCAPDAAVRVADLLP